MIKDRRREERRKGDRRVRQMGSPMDWNTFECRKGERRQEERRKKNHFM